MNTTGWVKIHRSMIDWEWFSEPSTAHFFIYCLLSANHEDAEWHGITIKRGSFVSTIEKMAAECGLTSKIVRTAIQRLQRTGEILANGTNKNTHISICKFEEYQSLTIDKGQTKGKQRANKRQTKGKQKANKGQTKGKQPINMMNKNDKKERNKERKNISSSESEVVEVVEKNQNQNQNTDPAESGIDYVSIAALWNEKTKGMCGRLMSIENQRRELTNARIARYGLSQFIEAINTAADSEYLMQSSWFNYDWFVRPNNFDKVISGNYNDNKTAKKGNGSEDDNRLLNADEYSE